MSSETLYTIGGLSVDDVVLSPTGKAWMNQPGGNAIYSALGARYWWDRVVALARTGYDYPPEAPKEVERLGIRLELKQIDAPSPHVWMLYEPSGERQCVPHLESSTHEAIDLDPESINEMHLMGPACHVAPMPTCKQATLVAILKRAGRVVSLDPFLFDIAEYRAECLTLLADIDIFLPSEIEATILYGTNAPEDAARDFARRGPALVAIKLGSTGSVVYDRIRDRLLRVPAFPTEVRDPTGAGDAFCGGFLAG